MVDSVSLTYNDYDGQAGIVSFNVDDVDATNFATIFGWVNTTMRDAINAITLGVDVKTEINNVQRYASSNTRATNPSAQRGNKWAVYYRDDTDWLDAPANTIPNPGYLKPFSVEIPTADLSLRDANSNVVWTGGVGVSSEFDDFAIAFVAQARSPYGGLPALQRIESTTRSGG